MTLESLKRLFAKRQFELRDFIAAAAAGRDYDEGALVDALMAAGLGPEEFEQAVELKRKRQAAVELLKNADDTSGKLEDNSAAAEAARSEFQRKVDALGTKLQARLEELRQDSANIMTQKSRFRAATRLLISTADPELISQENELAVLLRISREKLQAAQRDVTSAEYAVAHPQKHTDIDSAEAYLGQMQARRDSVQREVNSLAAELEAVRGAKLEA